MFTKIHSKSTNNTNIYKNPLRAQTTNTHTDVYIYDNRSEKSASRNCNNLDIYTRLLQLARLHFAISKSRCQE